MLLQVYSDRDMAISVHMISGKKASRERAAVLDLVATSSKLLTRVQARVLLECLDDPIEKVSFYSRIMTKIVDDPVGKATLLVLSDEEQQVLPLVPQVLQNPSKVTRAPAFHSQRQRMCASLQPGKSNRAIQV